MGYDFKVVMDAYDDMCGRISCSECPLNHEHFDYDCTDLPFHDAERFAYTIMEWYKTHQKIYPTVREVVSKIASLMGEHVYSGNSILEILDDRLNDETADYFNIKPINENTLKSNV